MNTSDKGSQTITFLDSDDNLGFNNSSNVPELGTILNMVSFSAFLIGVIGAAGRLKHVHEFSTTLVNLNKLL